MNAYDPDLSDVQEEPPRTRSPYRKSTGPGRERKVKARRVSRRKQGGGAVGGMHRRGSKRRSN